MPNCKVIKVIADLGDAEKKDVGGGGLIICCTSSRDLIAVDVTASVKVIIGRNVSRSAVVPGRRGKIFVSKNGGIKSLGEGLIYRKMEAAKESERLVERKKFNRGSLRRSLHKMTQQLALAAD